MMREVIGIYAMQFCGQPLMAELECNLEGCFCILFNDWLIPFRDPLDVGNKVWVIHRLTRGNDLAITIAAYTSITRIQAVHRQDSTS
ncbi:hypothetical protein VI06_11075 [Aquitalea magnusonii]|nr:hypothetical protein VI06_11075 [Aquitalea magnusonii]